MSDDKYWFLLFAIGALAFAIERLGKRVEAIYQILKFGKDEE